jgi:uroporphyrinogen-III synthase
VKSVWEIDTMSDPGPRIINTRPEGQNAELSDLLRKAGFTPVEAPLVTIIPVEEGVARLRKLPAASFTGVFLSSANGLKQMQAGLDEAVLSRWMGKPFFLVGNRGRALVESLGGRVAFVPEEASLQGFLREYRAAPGPAGLPLSQRWMHPCSSATRVNPAAFKERNVEIENIPVYKPGYPEDAPARLREAADVTAILFCSASAVDHFHRAAPEALSKAVGALKGVLAISIGASTTEALRLRGIEAVHEAPHADNEGLIDALRQAYGGAETKVLKAPKAPAAAPAAAKIPKEIPGGAGPSEKGKP